MDVLHITSIEQVDSIPHQVAGEIRVVVYLNSEQDEEHSLASSKKICGYAASLQYPCLIVNCQDPNTFNHTPTRQTQRQEKAPEPEAIQFSEQNYKKIYDNIFSLVDETLFQLANQAKQRISQNEQLIDIEQSQNLLVMDYLNYIKVIGQHILFLKPYQLNKLVFDQMKQSKVGYFPILVNQLYFNYKQISYMIHDQTAKKRLPELARVFCVVLQRYYSLLVEKLQDTQSLALLSLFSSVFKLYCEIIMTQTQQYITGVVEQYVQVEGHGCDKIKIPFNLPEDQGNVFLVLRHTSQMVARHNYSGHVKDLFETSNQCFTDDTRELILTMTTSSDTYNALICYYRLIITFLLFYFNSLAYAPLVMFFYNNIDMVRHAGMKKAISSILAQQEELLPKEGLQVRYPNCMSVISSICPPMIKADDPDLLLNNDMIQRMMNRLEELRLEELTGGKQGGVMYQKTNQFNNIQPFDIHRSCQIQYQVVELVGEDCLDAMSICKLLFDQFTQYKQCADAVRLDTEPQLEYVDPVVYRPDELSQMSVSELSNMSHKLAAYGHAVQMLQHVLNRLVSRVIRLCSFDRALQAYYLFALYHSRGERAPTLTEPFKQLFFKLPPFVPAQERTELYKQYIARIGEVSSREERLVLVQLLMLNPMDPALRNLIQRLGHTEAGADELDIPFAIDQESGEIVAPPAVVAPYEQEERSGRVFARFEYITVDCGSAPAPQWTLEHGKLFAHVPCTVVVRTQRSNMTGTAELCFWPPADGCVALLGGEQLNPGEQRMVAVGESLQLELPAAGSWTVEVGRVRLTLPVTEPLGYVLQPLQRPPGVYRLHISTTVPGVVENIRLDGCTQLGVPGCGPLSGTVVLLFQAPIDATAANLCFSVAGRTRTLRVALPPPVAAPLSVHHKRRVRLNEPTQLVARLAAGAAVGGRLWARPGMGVAVMHQTRTTIIPGPGAVQLCIRFICSRLGAQTAVEIIAEGPDGQPRHTIAVDVTVV